MIAVVDQLKARFNANAYSGRVEGGYRFVAPWVGGVGITHAAGQFTTFDLPAYAEQILSHAIPDSVLTQRGRFGWTHDFNPDRSIAATFRRCWGASFVVCGGAERRRVRHRLHRTEMNQRLLSCYLRR
jgi:hypothetical protein